MVQVGEQQTSKSCSESCARGLSPGQSKALICSNHSFPTLPTFSAPSKHGLRPPPLPKATRGAELSSAQQAPSPHPKVCPDAGGEGRDLQPDQFAIRPSEQPLSRALSDCPVMVSDWEQAGQHPGLRGPILALPSLLSQGGLEQVPLPAFPQAPAGRQPV